MQSDVPYFCLNFFHLLLELESMFLNTAHKTLHRPRPPLQLQFSAGSSSTSILHTAGCVYPCSLTHNHTCTTAVTLYGTSSFILFLPN